MTSDSVRASFLRELRWALNHIYDPTNLRKSPLVKLFGLERSEDPASSLRHVLVDAIERLKPDASVPPHSSACRTYRILFHRYTEQFTQHEVATDLSISVRQLRRQEHVALQGLVDDLWARYDLELKVPNDAALSRATDQASPKEGTPFWNREREWLQESLSREQADVAEIVRTVVQTARPLMQALNVRVESAVPENMPRAIVQLTTMRQSLLNILTAAIRCVPGECVRVRAEAQPWSVCIYVQPVIHQATVSAMRDDDVEKLEMARQLIELSGGSLNVIADGEREQPCTVKLILPAAQRVSVLVIDDNADTLQLLERYVSGTRYRFIGARDPEEALELAEELVPQIIVLDVMLPMVDGWELLGRLREHPKTRAVPIIVCTVLPQEELALALGAAAFMRKPISRNVFLSALDRQIDRLSRESR